MAIAYGYFFMFAQSIRHLTMKVIKMTNPTGMVIKNSHPNPPQKQFPSWHGSPVIASEIFAPAMAIKIGQTEKTRIAKSPSGNLISRSFLFLMMTILNLKSETVKRRL